MKILSAPLPPLRGIVAHARAQCVVPVAAVEKPAEVAADEGVVACATQHGVLAIVAG
jgi:hypothetical protein